MALQSGFARISPRSQPRVHERLCKAACADFAEKSAESLQMSLQSGFARILPRGQRRVRDWLCYAINKNFEEVKR